MKYLARTDANHTQIVEALRKAGIKVVDLSRVGRGCPDLLCSVRGYTALVEVKVPGGELEPTQRAFIETWPGDVFVVTDPKEAVLAVIEGARPR